MVAARVAVGLVEDLSKEEGHILWIQQTSIPATLRRQRHGEWQGCNPLQESGFMNGVLRSVVSESCRNNTRNVTTILWLKRQLEVIRDRGPQYNRAPSPNRPSLDRSDDSE